MKPLTKRRTFPTPDPSWLNQYAICNRSGLLNPSVHHYRDRARAVAFCDALGEDHWPVRLVPPPRKDHS